MEHFSLNSPRREKLKNVIGVIYDQKKLLSQMNYYIITLKQKNGNIF